MASAKTQWCIQRCIDGYYVRMIWPTFFTDDILKAKLWDTYETAFRAYGKLSNKFTVEIVEVTVTYESVGSFCYGT